MGNSVCLKVPNSSLLALLWGIKVTYTGMDLIVELLSNSRCANSLPACMWWWANRQKWSHWRDQRCSCSHPRGEHTSCSKVGGRQCNCISEVLLQSSLLCLAPYTGLQLCGPALQEPPGSGLESNKGGLARLMVNGKPMVSIELPHVCCCICMYFVGFCVNNTEHLSITTASTSTGWVSSG